ncbi:MAG: type I-G CRISPR-associated protein Cas8g1/Csx17 [Pseudomonadota bacterium]
MNEIVLPGCTPTPLASYLKALGVLRLLSRACPVTRAAWQSDHLVIHTIWDREAVEAFFLRDYQPTPVMAPWNGGSGFYENDNKAALKAIQESTSQRLTLYRECLHLAEQALGDSDRSASPKDTAKAALLSKLRGLLPDAALDWFDASVLLSGDSVQYPPLLGTGGNDGRLDFTNNFMQRLGEVLGLTDEEPSQESINWLKMALHGVSAPGLVKKAIGQFSPGQVGGPNATTGFEADSAINPWDFVLMIEGALPFAAAAVRRNADDPEGVLSYPFTVRAVSAGAGSLGEGDAASARGELWMPLWRQPATYPEVRALLAEGRVAWDRKPVRDALDFVRAVHRLGGYRGIDSFQRYGLLMRSGKAYLAMPLARVEVTRNPETDWLDDLDKHDWLTRFRRFAQGENTAKRFLALRRQLEDALFDLAGRAPTPAEAQALLILLGDTEAALAVSRKAQESVPPIPRLSEHWVQAADDGMSAFRIARALAGLSGTKDAPLPLRAQLFPVHPTHNLWMDTARKTKGAADDPACRRRIHTESNGSLPDTLIALLGRRLWLAEEFDMPDKPLRSPAGTSFDDLLAFLRSDRMDRRIAALLPGLSLCSIPQDIKHAAGEGTVPAAFALFKLCLTPDTTLRSLRLMGEKDHLPIPPGLLAQLAAGNADNRAVRLAWRRLRASGLSPLFVPDALPELGDIDPRRAAAALLIPLSFGATGALGRSVLKALETETA